MEQEVIYSVGGRGRLSRRKRGWGWEELEARGAQMKQALHADYSLNFVSREEANHTSAEAAREHAECTRMTAVGRMVGFMTAEATGSSVISKPILLGTDVCAKRLVQAEMRRSSH